MAEGLYTANAEGHVTFAPATDFFGEAVVQYTVRSRAGERSNVATLSVTVTNVNDAPVITGQTPDPLSTPEETAITITADHLVVDDADNEWPADFSIRLDEGSDYSVSGLTITPVEDFSGILTVPVIVNDGEQDSDPFPLKVSVTPVNDRPRITGQQPDPLTTGQNEPLAITLGHLVVTDPDNTYPAEFTLTVNDGENYTVQDNTITPAQGFSGELTVGVTVSDPSESSEVYGLTVVVAANTPPVITGQSPMNTPEDTPVEVTLSHLVVTDPDNSYPEGFTLQLSPGEGYTLSGNTIIPVQDFVGALYVPVVVNDGVNDSEPYTLEVTVTAVNDAPTITGHVPLSTPENQSLVLQLAHLTVVDPDNAYPEGFTLIVMEGENYSVSGALVTPSPGFSGSLTVPVVVNDGAANSPPFPVVIDVTSVNDPPQITGQRSLEVTEGTAISLSLMDVTVSDADNTFPDDFTLVVHPGENYTFEGTTVTPAADFTGTLLVNVVVNDGTNDSGPFALQIAVTPLNDAPEITGQQPVNTPEDVSRTITLSDLMVSDPDNAYPTGFTLLVFPGDSYTLSGTTVIPSPDYHGRLTVPVQVTDGVLNSNVFDLAVQVDPVNDAPVITGQVPVETEEDTPVTISLSHLTVLDVDNAYPTGFTLVVLEGSYYSVQGTTVTPAPNFSGTLNVNVMVNDGVSNSTPFLFQIHVGNADDAPLITGQSAVSTAEETPVTLTLGHLTVTDPDSAFPSGFSLIVSPGENYTVSGTTITPAIDFYGSLVVPVRVNDGVNNSPTFDFRVEVTPVNDPPSFSPIPDQQVAENAPAGIITISGITKGPGENAQELTFVATSNNTAVISDPVIRYDGVGTTAALSYVVTPNASGIVTITIVAIDNGSNISPHRNSYSSSFQVEVLEINTAPTLDALSDITVMEDAELQHVGLSGITAGAGESQELSVSVSADKPGSFELLEVVYTSPQTTGLLRFKSAADVFGVATLSVTVTDNGSGVSPHVNAVTRTFRVTVQPVNDPPTFTSSPRTVAVVNERYEYRVTGTDPDGDRLSLTAATKPSWMAMKGAGNGEAILEGKPPAGASGNTPVTVQLSDGTTTVEQSFVVYVNVRPVVTSVTLATEEDHSVALPQSLLEGAYSDANGDAMNAILVSQLPAYGKLLQGSEEVQAGDTLSVNSSGTLSYVPDENFFGSDQIGWNASDGYHFSSMAATVSISVLPVNDPPAVVFAEDTLVYEVNGEPDFLAPLLDIIDPDDDTLTQAVIGFHARNYHPQIDQLVFDQTPLIRGAFDFQSGTLRLTGAAPLSAYRDALRSVRYVHQNTLDPLLEPKTVYVAVHDDEAEGERKDKFIVLQYTFVEFEIPSGFTPNGDQANDTWVIDRPGGGLEELDNAIISVYNKQGVLVFRGKGFDRPWDGTMNGEPLPADTYFYTIDLRLRNKKTYRGIVTILR